jgi:hypothetical protein
MEINESFIGALGIVIFGAILFLSLLTGLIIIIAQWKIYTKAGQPGWACLIPIYNIYILLKIIGKPWWWLILMFVPVANLIIAIWSTNLLSKRFGKDEGFTIGLFLLPIIFYPILGFGKAEYIPFNTNQSNDYFTNK